MKANLIKLDREFRIYCVDCGRFKDLYNNKEEDYLIYICSKCNSTQKVIDC